MEDLIRPLEITLGLTAITLLAWLIRRTFTHTIPRLAGDFKEALQQQFAFFQKEMKEQRDLFKEELKEQREALKELREDFKGEIQYLGQRIDRLSDSVRESKKGE